MYPNAFTVMAHMPQSVRSGAALTAVCGLMTLTAIGAVTAVPVPGYVAPTTPDYADEYVDDTRGVYIPSHQQQRMKTEAELANWQQLSESGRPLYAQKNPYGPAYEGQLNQAAYGAADTQSELNRIAQDPGLLAGGQSSQNVNPTYQGISFKEEQVALNDVAPAGMDTMPSLATGGQARVSRGGGDSLNSPNLSIAPAQPAKMGSLAGDGMEIAVSQGGNAQSVDMQNGIVRLKEERVAVRRALQRMMDQIGAGGWSVVWDLSEQNAGLPDMEISIYAEEPFINVLNALLGRLQTRSGQPLRVIRYDQTQRLVITDRAAGDNRPEAGIGSGPTGGGSFAVTEGTLKESVVSLHYDEIPLVDALENMVNQAGKGQWRLRMYAGTDQVLKPAHVEEPFGTAIERVLRVFGLRYEVFPGGKLIVVTASDKFGFGGTR